MLTPPPQAQGGLIQPRAGSPDVDKAGLPPLPCALCLEMGGIVPTLEMHNAGPSLVFWSYPLPGGALLPGEILGWAGWGRPSV